jgi:hypothetical protein
VGDCPNCDPQPYDPPAAKRFVYAIGSVEPRFADLGVEREFDQISANSDQAGDVRERAFVHELLSKPENRYLARGLCWVLTTRTADACSLVVTESLLDDYLAASAPASDRLSAVVGEVSRNRCLSHAPAVDVVQLLAFTAAEFASGVPTPQPVDPSQFASIVEEVFLRIRDRDGNHGLSVEHRALNFVALRYPEMYAVIASGYAKGLSLTAIDTRHRHLEGRIEADVVLTLRKHGPDGLERYLVRVDATDLFPFLAAPITRIYDY